MRHAWSDLTTRFGNLGLPGNLGTMLFYEVRNLIRHHAVIKQAPEMRGHEESPGMTPVLKGNQSIS
jgi:hypothetical protein